MASPSPASLAEAQIPDLAGGNRLKAYVEFSGRGKDKPLSYSTITKTLFSTFIRKEPLQTPMNFRLEIGENPRALEKEQLVQLCNLIAEVLFEGQYDFDLGTDKIEEKVRKDIGIPDGHLRATRISREEVVYSWLRYVHDLISRHEVADVVQPPLGHVRALEEIAVHRARQDPGEDVDEDPQPVALV